MERESIDSRTPDQLLGLIRKKLLVVDENLEDLLYYSAVLQHQGYEVRSIPSYEDGAAWVGREDFDLILLTQGSPRFEGRSVLSRAIERDRHAPVVVLSRSIDIPCYIEAMQCGALDYMEKPWLPSEIGLLVRKYLRSGTASA
ncbi:MAG: response regulator [Terriglobia bacterium]|jgi:DNA-binding NtrC family response regulator